MTLNAAMSLRLRLFILILAPLILVAVALGYWRYVVAQETAEELFDRNLLSTALAISRDVSISDGDALSTTTRDLIEEAAGGQIFYHVTGPGGIYVTGYAYPPRLKGEVATGTPLFAQADYRRELVRAVRLSEPTTIDNLSGLTTITVWQRINERQMFAQDLAIRAAILLLTLLGSLACLVWFGVHLGLRPLRDLHDAIALRSPDDLRQIKRPLPIEVKAIVATLNRLFKKLETSIETRQTFISDAAHQLRNPAAAILSLAETLEDAKDPVERKRRTKELVDAARSAARLTNQMLSFERLRDDNSHLRKEHFDLRDAAEEACLPFGALALERSIEFDYEPGRVPLQVSADRMMIVEAIRNLLDNALQHGGPALDRIAVETSLRDSSAALTVNDSGKGLDPKDAARATQRFKQLGPGNGSGLGLSIVHSVLQRHEGELRVNPSSRGASITILLPLLSSKTY